MQIVKTKNDAAMTVAIQGRLETTTSPELEAIVKNELDGVSALVFDFTELEYISSAGLRVLLAAQKIMNQQGSMRITNVNETIMEVFDLGRRGSNPCRF